MSKYTLVASYYDLREKNKNMRYKNEVEINGDLIGVNLSTIQDIDNFTASHTTFEIFKKIGTGINITNQNHLAIKYYKNKTADPKPRRVIVNNPEFAECTRNNQKIKYYVSGRTISGLAVPMDTKLFEKELTELLTILKTKNLEKFKKMYPYERSELLHLVEQYLSSPYDNDQDEYMAKKLIISEFSRYETFRGWIVARLKEKERTQFPISNFNNQSIKPKKQKNSVTPSIESHPIEWYEEEYSKNFQKAHDGMTPEEFCTRAYNTENDEFLDEEEVQTMYDDLTARRRIK